MSSTSTATEFSPLMPKSSIQSTQSTPPKPQRTVTFNPTVSSSSSAGPSEARLPPPATAGSAPQSSVLANLNNKLRRRSSQGAPIAPQNLASGPRIGPQRTTKKAEKLKILPDPDHGEDGPDEESGRDVYSQFTRIKDPTARRDAARLGKADRERLPRVTAYCTASSLRLDELMRYLKGKARSRGAMPKLFDECIYTPYRYEMEKSSMPVRSSAEVEYTPHRRYSDSAVEVEEQRREDLIDLHNEAGDISYDNGDDPLLVLNVPQDHVHGPSSSHEPSDFDIEIHIPEVFLFEYGTVVIWGMTLQQEHRFLREIAKFENEKLDKDTVQTEDFNFYYTKEYQARIYNDFITLSNKKNYMAKLAISHALSQSVKVDFSLPLSMSSLLTSNRPRSTKLLSMPPLSSPRRSPHKLLPPER